MEIIDFPYTIGIDEQIIIDRYKYIINYNSFPWILTLVFRNRDNCHHRTSSKDGSLLRFVFKNKNVYLSYRSYE